MTKTMDIIKKLFDANDSKLEIMKILRGKELKRSEIVKELDPNSKMNFESALEYLDKVALIDHVLTKDGNFYRLSARGKSLIAITDMMKDEVGE